MNRTRSERQSGAGDAAQHEPRAQHAPMGMTWPPALPFEEALRRAREGDQHAMGLLYKRFLPVVYRYTLARVGDVHTAEDLTSETFFVVVDRIAETRARDELTLVAWALGIARNQVAMHFRRLKTRPTAPLLTDDNTDTAAWLLSEERDPLDIITLRESLTEVAAALDRLTEEQRSVILYRCVLGYSADDVARLLDKQPGAIRALQFRALASLARLLREREGAPPESTPSTSVGARQARRMVGER